MSENSVSDKIACITLSIAGLKLAQRLAETIGGDIYLHDKVTGADQTGARLFGRVTELTREIFSQYTGLIYIMPTGVVVRAVAGCIESKYTDAAVVVVDVAGRYALSLLSGHEGGANNLTMQVANIINAEPVVTTTTEAQKRLVAGVGCRRGVSEEIIISALEAAVSKAGYQLSDLRLLATAQIKADEDGLIKAARKLSLPLRIIGHSAIMEYGGAFERSDFVEDKIGLPAVAEPCALLGGVKCRLIQKKMILNGVTVALAQECCGLSG